ncbi:ROK family protein [Deinococcus sp. AJ005]|uniref:ROK family protein n=1 Tax=Deinococcus sp. AJ005 TaxID=2652443 RepID=UPI00125CCBB9|nr:ROK family protein [Deinococcus sp. AJ005]QFP75429.1 ROK family protein [Deinococcus sp. AJ005]
MGQPRELRRLNRRAVTQLLFSGSGLTRPQLADQTGLSKVTVNVVVQELLNHGIAQLSMSSDQGVGRTPQRVELRPQVGAILAVDLQPTQIYTQLSGLAGGAPRKQQVDCAEADLTDALLDVFAGALADAAYGPLCHVLIGLPAPVDPQGRVREPNVTHHLDVQRVTAFLDAAGVTYAFANDANLVALAATRETPGWSHVAVLVERPSGTGMGLLLGGELYRGMHGRAGEIGRSRWPGPLGAEPLESLPSPERLEATAFMLAGLVHTLDLQHVVLGMPKDRATALQDKLSVLLDLSITIHLLPDVGDAVLRGAALLARQQAHEHLLARVEDLGREKPDVA